MLTARTFTNLRALPTPGPTSAVAVVAVRNAIRDVAHIALQNRLTGGRPIPGSEVAMRYSQIYFQRTNYRKEGQDRRIKMRDVTIYRSAPIRFFPDWALMLSAWLT